MGRGIDVSHHQGAISWSRVASDGVVFAMAKATEGTTFQDHRWPANRDGAHANGIPVGAYHFARPSAGAGDAATEARHHLRHATPVAGEIVPALDLEATTLGPRDTTRWALEWLSFVEEAIGATPIVYTGPGWAATNLHPDPALARYPLWVAHYTTAPAPRLPEPWTEWMWWQHTDDGHTAGVTGGVDTNRMSTDVLPLWPTAGGPSTLEEDDMTPEQETMLRTALQQATEANLRSAHAITMLDALSDEVLGPIGPDGDSRLDRFSRLLNDLAAAHPG
jgi:lysozyme